jgi:predicted transcriptional regulator
MADTKHTKRELFETLLVFTTAAEAEDWVTSGIKHELELLNKRSANKKPNPKVAAEQRGYMDSIVTALEDADEPLRASAIATATGFSVQRVTALVKKMVDSGEVIRTENKKVATFSLT